MNFGPFSVVRLRIFSAGVALAVLAETGGPADLTSFGRDLVVAGVLFYFYRKIAEDFRKIIQENTAIMQKMADRLESMEKRVVVCPLVAGGEREKTPV